MILNTEFTMPVKGWQVRVRRLKRALQRRYGHVHVFQKTLHVFGEEPFVRNKQPGELVWWIETPYEREGGETKEDAFTRACSEINDFLKKWVERQGAHFSTSMRDPR